MSIIEPNRRGFITGLISLVAAPAIVRVLSLMPVKAIEDAEFDWSPFYTAYPIGPLQVKPVVYRDIMYWVTQAEPQIVKWSGLLDLK